ncbi:fibronectin-like [Asterias amurensis]|uniref:fibronectin-like n=1 Tax=Asterias amurensis TaxID=7602 RepID=UPI003AB45E9C
MATGRSPVGTTATKFKIFLGISLFLAAHMLKPVDGQLEGATKTKTPFSITLTWSEQVDLNEVVVQEVGGSETEDSPFSVASTETVFTVYHLKQLTEYTLTVTDTNLVSVVYTETTTDNKLTVNFNTPGEMVIQIPNFVLPPDSSARLTQIQDPLNTVTPVSVTIPLGTNRQIPRSSLVPGILYQFELHFLTPQGNVLDTVSQYRNALRAPLGISFSNREVSSITVTVQPTSLLNSVDYYSVDYNIVDDPAVMMERTVANSADLTDLTASVGYEVVVKAVAGLGGDRVESASVGDTFTLTSFTVDLRLATFLSLSWGSAGTGVQYLLEYSPNNGFPLSPTEVADGTNEAYFVRLTPGAEYTFQLYTRIGMVKGELVTSSVIQTLPYGILAFNISTTETSITLSWDAPTGADTYVVSYVPGPPGNAEVVTATEYTLNCLEPGTSYDITVLSMKNGLQNADGDTMVQTVVTGAGTPGAINIKQVLPSTVTFTWNEVPDATGYRVSINQVGIPGTPFNQDIGINVPREHTFQINAGSTLYRLSVLPLSSPTVTVAATRDFTSAPNVPGNLNGVTLSKDIQLTWTASAGATSYVIHYYENPDNTNAVTVEVPSTETSYDIANLTPETSYTVEVSGLQKSITDLCLTVQSQPASQVFTTVEAKLQVTQFTATTIRVTGFNVGQTLRYDPPGLLVVTDTTSEVLTDLTPGVEYTIYLVDAFNREVDKITQYTNPSRPRIVSVTSGSPPETELIVRVDVQGSNYDIVKLGYTPSDGYKTSPVEQRELTFVFDGLTPGLTYNFAAITVSGELESEPITQSGSTDPGTRGQIYPHLVTATSIAVKFGAVDSITGYRLTLSHGSMVLQQPLGQHDRYYEFTGLEQGTLYDVVLSTMGRVPPVTTTAKIRTLVGAPSGLTSLDITSRSISIGWSPAQGFVSLYEIGIRKQSETNLLIAGTVLASDPQVFLLENLEPDTIYVITVTSVIKESDGVFRSERYALLPAQTVIASVRVTARSENALALEWETFPSIDTFQLLYSPLDGTSPSPSLFPSFQTTFTLEELTAGIEYHIILEKSEGSVVSVIDAFSCFTLPPPPASATVEDVTSSEAVVLWEPPIVPGDYQGYLIQIKSASFEIVETFRRGRYDERRITMSFSGRGETLTACVFTTTGTAVEIVTSSPVLVDVTSEPATVGAIINAVSTPTTVTVYWFDAPDSTVAYQLQLNTETATGLQEATVTGLTEHTFSGLAPGVLYTVVLSVDDSRQSHKIRTAPLSPVFISAPLVLAESISIMWTPPQDSSSFDSYVIDWFPSSHVGQRPPTTVNSVPVTSTYLLNNLKPDTHYEIALQTVAGANTDYPSRSEKITLLERTGPLDEFQFIYTQLGATYIDIEFGKVTSQLIDMYQLRLFQLPNNEERMIRVDGDAVGSRRIDELIPGTQYNLILESPSLPGSQRNIAFETGPSKPDAVINHFDQTSVNITLSEPAGNFDGFFIQYSPYDGVTSNQQIIPKTGSLQNRIYGLIPGKEYTVSVSAYIRSTSGESTKLKFTTLPADPGEVVIRTYSTNQIEVYWGDGSHLPGFQRYTVAIEPQAGSTPAVDTVLRHATFSNLNPGDLYIITVTVDADDTLINTVSQRTKPNPPNNVAIAPSSALTPVNLPVSWSLTLGTLSSYVVTYVKDGTTTEVYIGRVNSDITSFVIADLDPVTFYTVRVFASAGSGDNLEFSEPATVTGLTAAIPPNEIFIRSQDHESVTFIWQRNQAASSYQVVKVRVLDNSEMQIENTESQEFTYDALSPATVYRFTITPITGQGINLTPFDTLVRTGYKAPSILCKVTMVTGTKFEL